MGYFALLISSLLVAVALGEFLLRLMAFSYPPFYRPDPILGLSHRPGSSGWFLQEGKALVVINSQGFRDRERPIPKPPRTYRIAVLGDSFVEAFQVGIEKSFGRQLERRLQDCGYQSERTIDVMNFGVSGYGTGQALRLLETRVAKYSPDMIILAFFPGNDVRNNSRALEVDKIRPFFILDDATHLVLDDSFATSPEFSRRNYWPRNAAKNLSQSLRILQLVYRVKDTLAANRESPNRSDSEIGLDDPVFAPPRDQRWADAWLLTERLIARIASSARGMNAQFVLVTLSAGIQVHPDYRVRAEFAAKLGVSDLFYAEQRLRAFAEKTGIAIITLAPQMQSLAQTSGVFLHGFPNTGMGRGHWNEAGHSTAAKLVVAQLCGSPAFSRTPPRYESGRGT